MKKLLIVVGARPNYVKVARFGKVAAARGTMQVRLVNTGQQSDHRMTRVFMEQFGLHADHELDIPAGTQLAQLANIMRALEGVLTSERPSGVMVVGDVTSTLAGALAANKAGLPLVHLESGLRSGDRSMPEEMNRMITDSLADHHFTTEPSGVQNLLREGANAASIHAVGNTMIDTMVAYEGRIQADDVLQRMGWGSAGHVLITMHRPSTVDDAERSSRMIELIQGVAARCTTILPLHPRTAHKLEQHGMLARLQAIKGLHVAPPLDYFAFQKLLATSRMVITDSGGLQEESTFRRIPCITLRDNTERPITVTEGTNELLALEPVALYQRMDRIFAGGSKQGSIPEHWDGHATERVMDVLERVL